ncbi:cti6 cyc8-tup1 interacting [Trichoderma arundinaceum]|uniref:Cti6 cyc8-tup1 interacting n=1 Tax=Trichoderma arundinaceum TaxID=490622 RepID=A0A395NJA9_TRIAR|nr:cti6 cyc8-tup1 interacting [Trichoderma arundinaceum]
MAPSSPRRSSRARALASHSQQSLSSTNFSRLERHTRSLNRPPSGKSTPSASVSSDPLDDIDDTLLGRRRKRGHDEEQYKSLRNEALDMSNDLDTLQDEEDEAVRCICGCEDYPGRPPVDGSDANFLASIELSEDVTGFFVQCDICKVWQHGACVGIFSAESSPEEYFCEQCRKDLHKIQTANNGQKYSKYLPLSRPARTASRATSIAKDGARSPRLGSSKSVRSQSTSQISKRRSTMNSRDAAYDDEQLRRAIEASKEEVTQDGVDGMNRRTKRGRSNSEENNVTVKRQRTNSRSISPPPKPMDAISRENTDDESSGRNGLKRARAHKAAEKSDREEKDRVRQEAISKRKGRADRRRTEDSDVSEEVNPPSSKTPAIKSAEPSSFAEPVSAPSPFPGTPPASHSSTANSHKRTSRSNHKKGKGKNQYTKDRNVEIERSPARSVSRDTQKASTAIIVAHSKHAGDHKGSSRTKLGIAGRMSMLDMKRRVAAIMDFISRTQVDLAAEATLDRSSNITDQPPHGTTSPSGKDSDSKGLCDSPSSRDFKELSCIEMMDVLTRDMVKWQNQYA